MHGNAYYEAMSLAANERSIVATNHALIALLIKFSLNHRMGWRKFSGLFFAFQGVEAIIRFNGVNQHRNFSDLKGALAIAI